MSAVISADGVYRYRLQRYFGVLDGALPLVFCMLNPSKADAEKDDPTIRRCIDYAKREHAQGLLVINLYAYRATDPEKLWKAVNPIGPDNYIHLQQVGRLAGRIVCAWGTKAQPEVVNAAVGIFRSSGAEMLCLGTTKDGHPRHPLYVKKVQPLIPWSPR